MSCTKRHQELKSLDCVLYPCTIYQRYFGWTGEFAFLIITISCMPLWRKDIDNVLLLLHVLTQVQVAPTGTTLLQILLHLFVKTNNSVVMLTVEARPIIQTPKTPPPTRSKLYLNKYFSAITILTQKISCWLSWLRKCWVEWCYRFFFLISFFFFFF